MLIIFYKQAKRYMYFKDAVVAEPAFMLSGTNYWPRKGSKKKHFNLMFHEKSIWNVFLGLKFRIKYNELITSKKKQD